MNRQLPVASRLLESRQKKKNNKLLFHKIEAIKYSNISAIKYDPHTRSKSRPRDLTKILGSPTNPYGESPKIKKGRIWLQNKGIYSRLVSQKSTIPTKWLAQERLKNVQYLKRIGKYPFRRRVNSVTSTESEDTMWQFEGKHRNKTEISNGRPSLSSYHSKPSSIYVQSENREHLILLFSKVVQFAKQWFTIKFKRFKNHYEINLMSYPQPRVEYDLVLSEQIGTALLTQTDYDYLLISQNNIKFNPQYVCLSFELQQPQQKRHFYRFEKKIHQLQTDDSPRTSQLQLINEIRQKSYRKRQFDSEDDRQGKAMRSKINKTELSQLNNFQKFSVRLQGHR